MSLGSDLSERREICGYEIVRALIEGGSYLARGEGRRQVVLKKVDEDCLLGSGLHPSIVERLSRVREVAHAGVANLYGVQWEGYGDGRGRAGKSRRGDGEAWLVWEYVEGMTLAEWTAIEGRTSRELLVMARELMLSVDLLHMQGIVHGAIVGGNVIVGADMALKLTHISPLLYSDFNVDVESVIGMLRDVATQCGQRGEALGKVLDQRHQVSPTAKAGDGEDGELREMAARVAGVLGGGERAQGAKGTEEGTSRIGPRMLVEALIVALVGLAVAYGVWRAFAG